MELRRVVELYDASRREHGSGYLLADRLILTARHVVGETGSTCQWRTTGPNPRLGVVDMDPWRDAVVVWVGDEIDAALLAPAGTESFAEYFDEKLKPVTFGTPSGRQPLRADAVGFPKAMEDASRTDLLHVTGTVDPMTGLRGSGLVFGVDTPAPIRADGWKGMSGSAVFAGNVLLGVVEEVPVSLGIQTLRITPAIAIVSAPAAASLLNESDIGTSPVPTTSEDVDSLPPEGRWELVRQHYAQAVVDQFLRLDYAGLPGDRGSSSRPALEGFRAQRFASVDADQHGDVGIDELATQPNVVILGEPGSGKSTALKQALALAVEQDPQCVPIWLPVSALPPTGPLTIPVLLQHITEQAESVGIRHINRSFFEAAAGEGKLVIAFDALDETHEVRRPAVRDLVQQAADTWPACRIWLSSRPSQYLKNPLSGSPRKSGPTPIQFKVWRIKPLEQTSVAEFLRVVFDDDGQLSEMLLARPDLATILETPQMLSMLARITQGERGLPESRAQIFEQWIEVASSTWEATKGQLSDGGEVADRKKGLQLIAWDVQQKGNAAAPFPRKQAQRAVETLFGPRGESGGESLINWLVDRSGVLAWQDEAGAGVSQRLIRFRHLQFQEYLAAAEFEYLWSRQRETAQAAAGHRWWHDDWLELLRFAVALMADQADDLFKAILDEPDPYHDLLRRKPLIVARLMSDVQMTNRRLADTVVRDLETAAIEAPYLYGNVCNALIGLGAHEAAWRALQRVASGELATRVIERNKVAEHDLGQQDELVRIRLAAIKALALAKGVQDALPLLELLPFPKALGEPSDVPIQILLDILEVRFGFNDVVKARLGFDLLIQSAPTSQIRELVVQRLDAIGESDFANERLAAMIRERQQSVDLSSGLFCFRRQIPEANIELLKELLLATKQSVEETSSEFFASDELTTAMFAAADLWKTNPTPEGRQLFEAALRHPGLLWYWADRIRELIPDFASKAVEAMVELSANPELMDNSRRNGMVYALCNNPDDQIAVPALLRLLESEAVLRWNGDAIIDSLRMRARTNDALTILKRQIVPGPESIDGPARALELAERLQRGVTFSWLDELWRTGPTPEADAARLEDNWRKSGVGRIARSWFAKLATEESGRAFLEAARRNPRDTALTDEARQALFGGVFDDPWDSEPETTDRRPPTLSDLEADLNEKLAQKDKPPRKRDVTRILESIVDLGYESEAIEQASKWIAELNPSQQDDALEIIDRLYSLSHSGLWDRSWTDLLAGSLRTLDSMERGYGASLLAQVSAR